MAVFSPTFMVIKQRGSEKASESMKTHILFLMTVINTR